MAIEDRDIVATRTPTTTPSLEDTLGSLDWGAIAGDAADRVNERRQGSIWEQIQERLTNEGAGTGRLDLDFDALQGDGIFDRLVGLTRGAFDAVRPDQAMLSDLIRMNWSRGEITEQQAIAALMRDLGLTFDAAISKIEIWDKDMMGGSGATSTGDEPTLWELMQMAMDEALGGGIGGRRSGGSGGGVARQYVGPDRGLVEDWVKQQLINKVGSASDDRIKMLTDTYMDDDRKNFGIISGESIDPKQSVLEKIRSLDDYKRIHALRVDGQDEDTWISGQMSELLSAGVSGAEAEKLAVNFAQAGVSKVRAGELSEGRRVGNAPNQALPGFFAQVSQNLSTVARSLR